MTAITTYPQDCAVLLSKGTGNISRFAHVLNGLHTENSGELLVPLKETFAYRCDLVPSYPSLNIINLAEELGDMLWFSAVFLELVRDVFNTVDSSVAISSHGAFIKKQLNSSHAQGYINRTYAKIFENNNCDSKAFPTFGMLFSLNALAALSGSINAAFLAACSVLADNAHEVLAQEATPTNMYLCLTSPAYGVVLDHTLLNSAVWALYSRDEEYDPDAPDSSWVNLHNDALRFFDFGANHHKISEIALTRISILQAVELHTLLLCRLINSIGRNFDGYTFNVETVAKANIAKLHQKRYKKGAFTLDQCASRNVMDEANVIEAIIKN